MLQRKATYMNKSKRDKLKEKKEQKLAKLTEPKRKNPITPIEIDSSNDEPQHKSQGASENVINLESESNKNSSERRVNLDESPQKIETPKKPNQFNYSRLSKLAALLENEVAPQRPQKLLDIVEDEGGINGRQPDAAKAYTFHVEGSKDEKNIRKIQLKDRATEATLVEARRQILKKAQQQQQVVQVTKEDVEDSDDHIGQRKNRYFAVSHELCYRCGKQGHYAVNCLEEWLRKCKNCFSKQHDERNCPQTCFQCGNVGHISSECVYRFDDKCQKCNRRGHVTQHCGMIIGDKMDWKKIQHNVSQSDLKRLKCIVQSQHVEQTQKGHHYNCFEYKLVSFPYQELRVNARTQDNVSLKDYQFDNNRRGNRNDRYDNRRPHQQSRQSNYGTHYGNNNRVMQHYRSRYNDITGAERGRSQNRSFEDERHRHYQHSKSPHNRQSDHRKPNNWKRDYYM